MDGTDASMRIRAGLARFGTVAGTTDVRIGGVPGLAPQPAVTLASFAVFFGRATRALWTGYAPNQALRFLLRCLLWPAPSYRWCRFLARAIPEPGNYRFAAGLLEKPHRPYVNVRWRRPQRMAALMGHYEIVRRLPLAGFLARAHVGAQQLARFETARGAYQLVLNGGGHSREGELELELRADGGRRVVMAAFSFIGADPALTVAIGCLQGGPAGAHDDILCVSRMFHGTPVKLLIVRLLRHLVGRLAGAAGVAHLIAVDDSAQIYQHRRYRSKHKVTASYGATWEALGGAARGDGFWELPVTEAPPDYTTIKSSKRSAARHRWEALHQAYAAVDALLAGVDPTPAAAWRAAQSAVNLLR